MSGISSSVGLISGLNTADLISQLMAIESQPMELLQDRVDVISAERTAFMDLSARLLSLKNTIQGFAEAEFFQNFRATSSNTDVLTAVAGENATLGSFGFQVHSLVANHSLISQGFADADSTPVGAGTITLEMGNGFLNPATDLELLNGGDGVRRGKIEITDLAGNSAKIDLTAVLSVEDVLEAINSQTAINVRAGVSGDRIVLEDLNTSDPVGSLAVRDLAGGHTAQDLGIAKSSTAGLIEGEDVIDLVDSTLLSTLNDGNGVGRSVAGADFTIRRDDGASFDISLSGTIDEHSRLEVLNNGNGVRLGVIRITDRTGATADVDLSAATNLGDVADAIEGAGLDVDVTYFNSSSKHALQLKDNSTGDGVFTIEDVSGYAARDLGLTTEADEGSLIGNSIHRITTVGDVMRAIKYAYDETAGEYNDGRILVNISESGNGLVLGSVGVPRGFEVLAGEDSTAADDLGITGRYEGGVPPETASRDLIAGLDTVLLHSLNGGKGITTGNVQFTDRAGASVQIDFAGAQTVQDVISLINSQAADAGVQISASVNPVGNGIIIRDESGSTANALAITDVSGTMAEDLGIAGTYASDRADSGNLQLQYVSGRTLLSSLNNGKGVRTGQFQITDSAGHVRRINITDNQKTVADVLRLINAASDDWVASINETGDGILITDNSGGAGTLTIEDLDGGYAAADLNIAGEADEGETTIDGSFEIRIDIDADDTLQDVSDKINQLGADYSAAVINDGSPVAPYRLSVNSLVSGLRGRILLDQGDTGLSVDTLVEARDAVVFFGGSDAQTPIVLRSSTNTLNDLLEGVTIDLVGTSDEPVDLSVTQDVDSIVEDLDAFVSAYNNVIDRIDDLTSFDDETYERGILFGDSTVNTIERRIYTAVTQAYDTGSEAITRLSTIGITIGDGGHLSLDETKFRESYAENPEAVEELFTAEDTGFGTIFDEVLDELTRSTDGTLARKDASLESREDLLNDRIDTLQILLDRTQERYERQFTALETALASLQSQQSALTTLESLIG